MVFDVIGGDILARSAALVRAGGTLVTIAEPPQTLPRDGRALFFLVEADRARLADLAARVRMGASSRWWAPCCHSPKLPPHSLPSSASLARRSCA